jgi:Glycerophosphoryl diester phosphodiesterase family
MIPISRWKRFIAPATLLMAGLAFASTADEKKSTPGVVPLMHAHAHNDYEHTRPLFEALENGFGSVEADVFLVDGKLLVGHTSASLRPERTLESLYLDPLRERAKANGGKIYPDGPTIFLLVDVKSKAKETCEALLKILDRYEELISVARDGRFEPRAVTVVVSGNCDRPTITAPSVRRAGIDGRPHDLSSDAPVYEIPWISQSWSALFHWRGDGPIPDEEKARLRDFTAKAHQHGRLVRFWATPEKVALWKELRADGVDLLNTDKLADLRRFLLEEKDTH